MVAAIEIRLARGQTAASPKEAKPAERELGE